MSHQILYLVLSKEWDLAWQIQGSGGGGGIYFKSQSPKKHPSKYNFLAILVIWESALSHHFLKVLIVFHCTFSTDLLNFHS